MSARPGHGRPSWLRLVGTAIPALAVALAVVAPRAEAQVWPYDTQEIRGITAGLRGGSLVGHTELGGKRAPQMGVFLRRAISNDVTGELNGTYGRIAGSTYGTSDNYGTDMGMADMRLLWAPLNLAFSEPYGYAGLGVVRFDLDRMAPGRTAVVPAIGWGATAPLGLGLYIPLFSNAGIDLSAGYTFTSSSDLSSVHGGGRDGFWSTGVGLVIGDLHPARTRRAARSGVPFVKMPVAPATPGPGSVTDAEARNLRAIQVSYLALRDSLGTQRTASSAAALETMQQMVYFDNDRADLTVAAKVVLRDKVSVFQGNPAMLVFITGFTSAPGTAKYNMALGLRRAEAAKSYLVSQGVDPLRIEIGTRGENELMVEGPGPLASAANRRGQFRLLVAESYLVAPTE